MWHDWCFCSIIYSDVPWNGPIAGVRMGRINGEFVVNPTKAQLEETDLNIVVAGTKDAILMVEGGAEEVPERYHS